VTPLRFIVDENLPPHLTYWLREKGYEANHVSHENLASRADKFVWSWAASRDAVVVSKDKDFLNRVVVGSPPRLIWITMGNTRKKYLIDRLAFHWPNIERALQEGEWMVEVADGRF
jgi:predicted nuclease of predicted toxin-antitoxin system